MEDSLNRVKMMLKGLVFKACKVSRAFFSHAVMIGTLLGSPATDAYCQGINAGGEPFLEGYEIIGTLELQRLLFPSGSFSLSGEQKQYLKAQLKGLRNKFIKVTIDAYTDAVGSEADNQLLSLRRADAVKNFLVKSLDFEERNLLARGHGENFAHSEAAAAESIAEDRKVMITAYILKSLEATRKASIIRMVKEESALEDPKVPPVKDNGIILAGDDKAADDNFSNNNIQTPEKAKTYFARVGIGYPLVLFENFSQNSGLAGSFSFYSQWRDTWFYLSGKLASFSGNLEPRAGLNVRSSFKKFDLATGIRSELSRNDRFFVEGELGLGFSSQDLEAFDDLESTNYSSRYSKSYTDPAAFASISLVSSKFFLNIAPFHAYELALTPNSQTLSILVGLAFRKN